MHIRHSAIKLLAKNLALITTILLATAAALRAQTTTSMLLTGVGDGNTFGDVYVDPYTATVGGTANIAVICDDWSDDSNLGDSWTATVINAATVSNSADGTPLFGNNQGLYNGVAWLSAQLLNPANEKNGTAQTEISFAIWQLTYSGPDTCSSGTPGAGCDPLAYMGNYISTSSTEYLATVNYLDQAESSTIANNNSLSDGWDILTPDPKGKGEDQEFMMFVPEPSQYGTLGADLALFAVAVLVLRRRGFLASRLARTERALHS